MNGLRWFNCLGILSSFLFASCGSSDLPPAAGSLSANDPEATAEFAAAQAAEASGNLGTAIKRYEEIADEHPYSEVAAQARFRQAALLERRGELLEAFDAYQQFVENYQGSPLYLDALSNQAVVAHAAADGIIKNSFLGIKSRLDNEKIVEMLAKVRDNAPRAPSAAKAQFAIGELWENKERREEAIEAFQLIVDDYSRSRLAPEAQYRIGTILLGQSSRGNRNKANLDKARYAFEDLLQRYPNSARAGDARTRIAEIETLNLQRNYDIAEFYYKKGEYASAAFYFREVRRKAGRGPLYEKAGERLALIEAR